MPSNMLVILLHKKGETVQCFFLELLPFYAALAFNYIITKEYHFLRNKQHLQWKLQGSHLGLKDDNLVRSSTNLYYFLRQWVTVLPIPVTRFKTAMIHIKNSDFG